MGSFRHKHNVGWQKIAIFIKRYKSGELKPLRKSRTSAANFKLMGALHLAFRN